MVRSDDIEMLDRAGAPGLPGSAGEVSERGKGAAGFVGESPDCQPGEPGAPAGGGTRKSLLWSGDLPVVRRVSNEADRREAMRIRHRGYRRYFERTEEVVDDFDEVPNHSLFLARCPAGAPVGTIRVLERSAGPIELDRFIDVAGVVGTDAVVEATRFSVPPGPWAKSTKLLLWKTVLEHARMVEARKLVVFVREAAARDYRFLLFEDVPGCAGCRHPELGNHHHRVLWNDLGDVERRFREAGHPLHRFMFETDHSSHLPWKP